MQSFETKISIHELRINLPIKKKKKKKKKKL